MNLSIEFLNEKYFNGRLSAAVMAHLQNLPNQHPEVQSLTHRMFRLMSVAHFRAEDFPPILAWAIGFILPRIVPQAWGGLIPPITLQGRHAKIDEYLAENPWATLGSGSRILDLGCGFPPLTTVDTAAKFPEWQVIGADPSFGRYIVYDKNGDYACFANENELRYFQPGPRSADAWEKMLRDSTATKAYFQNLLDRLLAIQPASNDEDFLITTQGDTKLIKNPVREYERENLKFVQAGIGDVDVQNVDLVRCFNVLIYFDQSFRQKALEWVTKILKPGGLFICGMDWIVSMQARYTIYRKESQQLVPKEFSFSLDNVRPLSFISWMAFHDRDPETEMLAKFVGTLRSDPEFCDTFDRELDRQLEHFGFAKRNPDGYLINEEIRRLTPTEVEQRTKEMDAVLDRSGLSEEAVTVLRRNGYECWRNEVGHISITPHSTS